ncbi:MAG: metal ABC transporter substrate-binding protein [Lachnospiraceae bacterium]|nr:metal ABC transporter substrate-binding protein [Lachnospiraceae bacterium]
MKKIISILMTSVLMIGCLSSCGTNVKNPAADGEKLQIVTTIFPEYDWMKNVLGDNPAGAELTLLLNNGVDLHSYQPTTDDILKISTCDIFVYVGGESDEWVDDALENAANKDMVVINLIDVLGDSAKVEEAVEGMQEEEEEESGDDEIEYDEHVWLSLKNAAIFTDSIEKALEKADPSNAGTYSANAEAYIEKLDALDARYQEAVSKASVKTLLFGDRFPFRYLTDDYGLSYYAAFAGCSAETEASFDTITFLAKKMDELSLHAVTTIEGQDHRLAETIIENTASKDQKIVVMDSMQATTEKDIEEGTTYLLIMEENLSALEEILE